MILLAIGGGNQEEYIIIADRRGAMVVRIQADHIMVITHIMVMVDRVYYHTNIVDTIP